MNEYSTNKWYFLGSFAAWIGLIGVVVWTDLPTPGKALIMLGVSGGAWVLPQLVRFRLRVGEDMVNVRKWRQTHQFMRGEVRVECFVTPAVGEPITTLYFLRPGSRRMAVSLAFLSKADVAEIVPLVFRALESETEIPRA